MKTFGKPLRHTVGGIFFTTNFFIQTFPCSGKHNWLSNQITRKLVTVLPEENAIFLLVSKLKSLNLHADLHHKVDSLINPLFSTYPYSCKNIKLFGLEI